MTSKVCFAFLLLVSCAARADCIDIPGTPRHHVARIVHNLTHWHKAAQKPKPQLCVEPEFETVTVTASADVPDLNAPDQPGEPSAGWWAGAPGGAYTVSGYPVYVSQPALPPEPVPRETLPPRKPQSVPEPSSFLMLLSGVAALFARRRIFT